MQIPIPALQLPFDFYRILDDEFSIDKDVFATKETTHAVSYIDDFSTSLKTPWEETNLLVLPSEGKVDWFKKIHNEIKKDKSKTVIVIAPVSMGSLWFHNYCAGQAEIRFVNGRIPLDGSETAGTKDSMVLIFGKKAKRQKFNYSSMTYRKKKETANT